MKLWVIEPRDPLIVRDGRPFGPNPGARAATLPFPVPSTVVGALRHKAGLNAQGVFDRGQIDVVLSQGMRGPLLVQLSEDDSIIDWLLPAPGDALLLQPEKPAGEGSNQQSPTTEDELLRFWLAPRQCEATTNAPDDLALVAPSEQRPEKISPAAPRFWSRKEFYRWLMAPADDKAILKTLGLRALEVDTRMHVGIQPQQQTAIEGALFQTSGLGFTWRTASQGSHGRLDAKRLALAAWYSGETPFFEPGFAPMGGERRLMRWYSLEQDVQPFSDEEREAIFAQIIEHGRCRVMLLTPAHFAAGYRPAISWERKGVTASLKAAVVTRMQTVPGWDMDADNGKDGDGKPRPRGKPRPTRRLAPAGSVYYVDFAGLTETEMLRWLAATWMCNVSDDARDDGRKVNPDQHRLDGFGLAVVGLWPGSS